MARWTYQGGSCPEWAGVFPKRMKVKVEYELTQKPGYHLRIIISNVKTSCLTTTTYQNSPTSQ